LPPHIKRRLDRDGVYYLVDGRLSQSLKTKVKRYALAQLEQYNKRKFGLGREISIGDYYEGWIETRREPLVRRSLARDYRQHFACYILPEFRALAFRDVTPSRLTTFQSHLTLKKGLAVKTARNIIDGSFRAMWRDAMAAEIVDRNPFAVLKWPKVKRSRPDPFTSEERDRIVAWWRDNDFFYYPWVATLFHTGMRPSEAAALTWADVDLEARSISIGKSRYMGVDSPPKTSHSNRVIAIPGDVAELLALLPSLQLGLSRVFVNKFGEAMNAKKWSEHNWAAPLKKLDIRHRKFYATRHTFITEMVKAAKNLKAVADYCGTSVAMIEADYCGVLSLNLDQTVLQPVPRKYLENMVAGPGFEPGTSRL
jgi:integrase